MSFYAVKAGWNATLTAADRVSPQPFSPGIKASRRTLMGDGSILDQGAYAEWIYSVIESSEQLLAILTPMGLNSQKSNRVTVYTRDDMYNYHTYNAVAQRPPASWENYFARDVVIIFANLRYIS